MDQKKLAQQAQVLRNKRIARNNTNPPKITGGIVRFERPIPQKSNLIDINPPTPSQIKQNKAQQILEQRIELLQNKNPKQVPISNIAVDLFSKEVENAKKDKGDKKETNKGDSKGGNKGGKGGCSGCRRGK